MTALIGKPREKMTREHMPPTNPKLVKAIVTQDVGPFLVTGHTAAIASLKRIFANVYRKHPTLYAALGSAGMLNCRLVRGSKTAISNHAWGMAIDIKINDVLDTRGDGYCQRGLLELYPFFHEEGWYWGAEFGTEDAMHFEVSDETVRKWAKAGLL